MIPKSASAASGLRICLRKDTVTLHSYPACMNTRRILVLALCAGIILIAALGSYVLWDKPEPAGSDIITRSPETKSAPAAGASSPGQQGTAATPPSPAALALAEAAVASAKLKAEAFLATAGRGEPAEDASLEKDELRRQELLAEAGARATEDPKAALAWALAQGDHARTALDAVLDVLLRKDPAAAFQEFRWLQAGDGQDLRGYGLSVILERWADADPAAAASAVATLAPAPGNAHLMARVLSSWSEKDARGAAERLKSLATEARSGADLGLTEATFASVAGRLAAQDPARATEWALSFPAGTPERASAVAGVVSGWYEKDAKAVSDWLNDMEDSTAHDAGAAALVRFCQRIAPEVAMQWAEDVSDEKQRRLLTIQVAVNWLTADPKKAEAWLRKSNAIDAEQKEMILNSSRLAGSVGGAVPTK